MDEKAGEIVDAYAKAFPDKKPVEIWSMMSGPSSESCNAG